MTIINISVAHTTFKYHGVTYTVDDTFSFFALGLDGKWYAVNANRIPAAVVEAFRSQL